MKVILNGKSHEVEGDEMSVIDFVATLPLGEQPVLVEKNGEAILTREFGETMIQDGDVLEVIRMVAGG